VELNLRLPQKITAHLSGLFVDVATIKLDTLALNSADHAQGGRVSVGLRPTVEPPLNSKNELSIPTHTGSFGIPGVQRG